MIQIITTENAGAERDFGDTTQYRNGNKPESIAQSIKVDKSGYNRKLVESLTRVNPNRTYKDIVDLFNEHFCIFFLFLQGQFVCVESLILFAYANAYVYYDLDTIVHTMN